MEYNKVLVSLLIVVLFMFGCIDNNQEAGINETIKNQNDSQEKQGNPDINIGEINVIEEEKTLNITDEERENLFNYSDVKEETDTNLYIYFFDSGDYQKQKNGRFIVVKRGRLDIVIDASINEKYGSIMKSASKIIDDIEILVIATPNEETMENAKKLIDDVGVGEIWYSYMHENELSNLKSYAESKGITLRALKEGDEFEYGGIKISVLNPPSESSFEDIENNAPVFKILYKDESGKELSAMITTNIKDGAMGRINADYKKEMLNADVLEMPNYGDRVGQMNTRLFLSNVNPKIAILQGYKPFDMEESTKFASYNLLNDIYKIKTYETWNGDVVISFDGEKMGVETIE